MKVNMNVLFVSTSVRLLPNVGVCILDWHFFRYGSLLLKVIGKRRFDIG